MNRYQLIKKEEGLVWKFIKAGILSYQILRDVEIYEQFQELKPLSKEARYHLLANDFELSSYRVKQIIQSMEKLN